MGYVDKNLMSGENVVYRAKLHWAVFVWPLFWFILLIFFFNYGKKSDLVGGYILLISIGATIASFVRIKTSEFAITNKRVIVKVGFIRRKSYELLLNKIEGIQVDQGMFGRILDFGSITISGTGGTRNPFHKIASPFEFRKKAQEQIAAVQDSK
jgi:uncharacterized membrane protein YdbT with pleckstrin-like domain